MNTIAEGAKFPWAALERSVKRAIKKQLDEGVLAFLHLVAEEHRLDVTTLTNMWEAFQTETAAPPARKPSRRETIAPAAPAETAVKKKRRMSAYNFFCKTERQTVLQKYPETTSKEVVKRLASEWKGLSNTEKAVWKDRLEEHLQSTETSAEPPASESSSSPPEEEESHTVGALPASPVSPVRAAGPREPSTPVSPPFHAATPSPTAVADAVADAWEAGRAEAYSPSRPNVLTEEFEARAEEEEEEVDLREGLRLKLEGKTDGQLRKICSKYGIRRVATSETSKRDMIEALMHRLAPLSP